jgi:hypothetical protein
VEPEIEPAAMAAAAAAAAVVAVVAQAHSASQGGVWGERTGEGLGMLQQQQEWQYQQQKWRQQQWQNSRTFGICRGRLGERTGGAVAAAEATAAAAAAAAHKYRAGSSRSGRGDSTGRSSKHGTVSVRTSGCWHQQLLLCGRDLPAAALCVLCCPCRPRRLEGFEPSGC